MLLDKWNSQEVTHVSIMVRILERGITLVHPSGNKSDEKTCLFFLAVFEMKYTGAVFSTSLNFIHRFELVKLSCNQKKNQGRSQP